MANGNAAGGAPPERSGPQIIFDNWVEMLNRSVLSGAPRHVYQEAIEGYLDYCRLNGLSVRTETARSFMSDALRRGLTSQGSLWKEGLNWFFREGKRQKGQI